jgi:uncharacterized membrane protein
MYNSNKKATKYDFYPFHVQCANFGPKLNHKIGLQTVNAVFPYVFVFLPLAMFIFVIFILFVVANAGAEAWTARRFLYIAGMDGISTALRLNVDRLNIARLNIDF